MSPAKKAFRAIVLVCVGIGIIAWVVKLIAPDAVAVTWNGEALSGFPALVFLVVLGAILGVIFGLIVAGIVALFTRSPAKG